MLVRQVLPLRRAPADHEAARWLRDRVETLAVPRHADAESRANGRVAEMLALAFEAAGLRVFHQGRHRNVVALPHAPGPRAGERHTL